jgi:rhodanese-related sulfurtransferase
LPTKDDINLNDKQEVYNDYEMRKNKYCFGEDDAMKHILFILIILTACSNPEIINLEPNEAKELLKNKEEINLFVLNVHTPYEGKIENTDAIIEDWENIATHSDQLPEAKNTPIFVYCRSGRMSTSAVQQLKKLGYKKIYHLNGGMKAWDQAGFKITDKSRE